MKDENKVLLRSKSERSWVESNKTAISLVCRLTIENDLFMGFSINIRTTLIVKAIQFKITYPSFSFVD